MGTAARVAESARELVRRCPSGPASRVLRGAIDLIVRDYEEGRHQIACCLSDEQSNLFLGLHLEAMVGRASVCAEACALGEAVLHHARNLDLIVAVRHPKACEVPQLRVVPPCGLCRELLLDYANQLKVVVDVDPSGSLALLSLTDLLPQKYVGSKW